MKRTQFPAQFVKNQYKHPLPEFTREELISLSEVAYIHVTTGTGLYFGLPPADEVVMKVEILPKRFSEGYRRGGRSWIMEFVGKKKKVKNYEEALDFLVTEKMK